MFTDPPFDVADSEPPLMPLVVTSPAAVTEIAAAPDTSEEPSLAAPPDAVMPIAPLFVTIALLTATAPPAFNVTPPPAAPPRPSICALTAMSRPAAAVSALPLRGLRTASLIWTSCPALRSTRPVASMTPLTFTDPPVDVADSDPPLTTPVVRSPADRMAMALVPENTPMPAATVAVPPVAVRLTAPLLVASDWLTLRLRPAVRPTVPPAAPPRPSIWALTLTSRPALTASAPPLCPLRIRSLMFTSVPAEIRASPVTLSINPLRATDPFVDAIESALALNAPVLMSPRAFTATAPVPATTALPDATLTAPLVAVNATAPLLVTIVSLTFTSRVAVIATAPPASPPRPSTRALTLMSLPALTFSPVPVARLRIG